MKWIIPLLILLLPAGVPAAVDDTLHRDIRQIRRAYLDVLGLLPSPEEVDWYVVYNQNGYLIAVDFLTNNEKGTGWRKEQLLDPAYREAQEEVVERSVLEKNVVYLAGLWRGEFNAEVYEAGVDAFIKNALTASDDNISNTIDYMVNLMTCRPSTAEEENELSQIFNKVSLKADEMSAWRTVLLHILELHDCKTK